MPDNLITTLNNNKVDIYAVVPGDFTHDAVSRSLSNKCRFGGFTKPFYSVAQHCVLVSNFCSDKIALQGLLHELDEVFLPDMPTPIKSTLPPEWHSLAKDHHMTGCHAFGIDHQLHETVKVADKLALFVEADNFMGKELAQEILDDLCMDYFHVPIHPLPPEQAYVLFRERLKELTKNHAATTVSN